MTIKQILYRRYYDKDLYPRVESLHETELGVIHSNPEYQGGGWDAIEQAAYAEAMHKYIDLLRNSNQLIEAQDPKKHMQGIQYGE